MAGRTPEEEHIIQLLAEANEEFKALPDHWLEEWQEFFRLTAAAQEVVHRQSVRRVWPEHPDLPENRRKDERQWLSGL